MNPLKVFLYRYQDVVEADNVCANDAIRGHGCQPSFEHQGFALDEVDGDHGEGGVKPITVRVRDKLRLQVWLGLGVLIGFRLGVGLPFGLRLG